MADERAHLVRASLQLEGYIREWFPEQMKDSCAKLLHSIVDGALAVGRCEGSEGSGKIIIAAAAKIDAILRAPPEPPEQPNRNINRFDL